MKSRLHLLLLVVMLAGITAAALPSVAALSVRAFRAAPESVGRAFMPALAQRAPSLWVSAAVPASLRDAARGWGISVAAERAGASLVLDVGGLQEPRSEWVYALVAPFPTVEDSVTFSQLLSRWHGTSDGPFSGEPILMDDSTRAALVSLWGEPAPRAVQVFPANRLLDTAWNNRPSWAIVPFEALDPRWKVLEIDGQSPVRKEFSLHGDHILQASPDYPLHVEFGLTCTEVCDPSILPSLPRTNRDPARMTTVVMTGVTALVRATAFTMNTKGIDYPARDIRDWLMGADITHISNEVPFADDCPPPDPGYARLVFCSDPRYIDLLRFVGADVIELTGNHYADYGPEAMLLTLRMYRRSGMAHYGGGADLEDAHRPLLLEDHGNKIAFIGCNSPDVGRKPTATETRPGAAPCDYEYMTAQIRSLREQGYLVITSFQYYESYSPRPFDQQAHDFRLVSDAGAVIVQGSQAHNPQSFEFNGASLIHYGLGNLFFDQMGDASNPTRQEFIDRHVFYDGRYISTELLTAELEDYARPRPMTPEERAAFLRRYFEASGW